MTNTWATLNWAIARAGGFTALLLLTLAVVAGLAMSIQWQSASRWPRLVNNELHNFLTLFATIFVSIHVLSVWIDPFTHFNWYEVFIPFMSSYRPFWTALGIISLYLGLAIGITTLLRPRIGYRWWRRLHIFTLLIYALVVLHGITSGSDTQTWWGVTIYAASLLAVCPFVAIRVLKQLRTPQKKRPVQSLATSRRR